MKTKAKLLQNIFQNDSLNTGNETNVMSRDFRIELSVASYVSCQCYTPTASVQLKKDWDIQAKACCKDRAAKHQL